MQSVWITLDDELDDALVRGDACPDCAHLASGQNPHGFRVADLSVSRLDLMKNQFVPGYCVLYARRHIDPYREKVILTPEAYAQRVRLVRAALERG